METLIGADELLALLASGTAAGIEEDSQVGVLRERIAAKGIDPSALDELGRRWGQAWLAAFVWGLDDGDLVSAFSAVYIGGFLAGLDVADLLATRKLVEDPER